MLTTEYLEKIYRTAEYLFDMLENNKILPYLSFHDTQYYKFYRFDKIECISRLIDVSTPNPYHLINAFKTTISSTYISYKSSYYNKLSPYDNVQVHEDYFALRTILDDSEFIELYISHKLRDMLLSRGIKDGIRIVTSVLLKYIKMFREEE